MAGTQIERGIWQNRAAKFYHLPLKFLKIMPLYMMSVLFIPGIGGKINEVNIFINQHSTYLKHELIYYKKEHNVKFFLEKLIRVIVRVYDLI